MLGKDDADLAGAGEWAKHLPSRTTGPNAERCGACHNVPVEDGAGLASSNIHRDPLHSGNLGSMIQRNTPHLFAPGAIQRLGDLKRHDMGPGLAEPIDEVGTGSSAFLTENLWGVGSTAPYLHDGRATRR
ncbi:MAG: hypothetical protein ACREIU_13090 [Planctomycetota bacterium]